MQGKPQITGRDCNIHIYEEIIVPSHTHTRIVLAARSDSIPLGLLATNTVQYLIVLYVPIGHSLVSREAT